MRDFESVPLSDFIEYPVEEMHARATSFLEDMKRRHTLRQFSDRSVPRGIIETCLLTAGRAPSGANHQPWHFSVIGSPKLKARIRAAAEKEERTFYAGRASEEWLKALAPLGTDDVKPYIERAPWLIAIFGQRRGGPGAGDNLKNYYVPESVGIAAGFLICALHHAGLAALTHTPSPMGFLNKICGRPETEKAYILLVVGYPDKDAVVPTHALQKKSLDQIASFL